MKALHKPMMLGIVFLLIGSLLVACVSTPAQLEGTGEIDPTTKTALPTPSATAVPLTVFNVCTAVEPASLYRYDGRNNPAKESIFASLYANPFKSGASSSAPTPALLESLPSLDNGGISFASVDVQPGDVVVDAYGQLTVFKSGLLVRPAGCQSSDCALRWETGSFSMDQMQLRFSLQPGFAWSDGEALTAQDSVFSYAAARAAALPRGQWALDRTQAYTAEDALTLVWQGVPGFSSADVSAFFWAPLPLHQLEGVALADLGTNPTAAQAPLAWGAYRLLAWEAGQALRLEKNPQYLAAAQESLSFDLLNFLFVPEREQALSMLASGACDLVDASYALESLSKTELSALGQSYRVVYQQTDLTEQLVFGIKPAAYDDGYSVWAEDRPDFFGDLRVRQAVAACLDVNDLVSTVLDEKFPAGAVSLNYPLTKTLAEADALLSAAGWKDSDGDPSTPRLSSGIVGIFDRTAFEVQLLTGTSQLHQSIGNRVVESLGACGIAVDWQQLPAEQLYEPGPDGALFGRRFDLALLAWQPDGQDPCALYTSSAVPSSLNGWVGTNLAGMADETFDRLCGDSLLSTSATDPDAQWQTVLAALPAIPLLPHVRVWAAGSTLQIADGGWFGAE